MYGITTLALPEKQLEKVQVYEHNWVRRIEVGKRADKRRMEELRVTVGAKESLKKTDKERRWWKEKRR